MLKRFYCFPLVAISGLLFSLTFAPFWGTVILLASTIPIFISEKNQVKQLLFKLFLLFFVFIAFYIYGWWLELSSQTSLTGEEHLFSGQVVTEATLNTYGQTSFVVELDNGERIQAFSSQEPGLVVYGDYCLFEGKLSEPNVARNPYGFDYNKYLKQQRIHWIVTLDDKNLQCKVKKKNVINLFLNYRKDAMDQLMEMDKEGEKDTAPLISALVFGERGDLSEERIKSYQQLGILHLLAVSGLHVGILSFSIFYLLCRLGITRERASLIIIILLPIYMVIAGGAPSVMRASLMSVLFLAVSFTRWRVKGIDIISIVCLALLIYNPYYLFHLGFQLSFLTSFALILSNRLFHEHRYLLLTLTVTFVAQLISLPLILYHFFEVSLLTIPINLLFIPFISMWILPLSYITTLFFAVFPPLAIVPFKLISVSIHVAHGFIDKLLLWDGNVLLFGKPNNWMILALYVFILLLFIALEQRQGKLIIVSGMLLIFLLTIQFIIPYFRQEASIVFLDVGQGDAAVIELPKNKGVYLIDTGGVLRFNKEDDSIVGPGKRVIEPYLKGRGIKKIDKLFLTHGHLDHMGEACYVVSNFLVKNIFYPAGIPVSDEAKNILDCMKEEGISLQLAKDGMQWSVAGNRFMVIHPTGKEKDENNRSIVFIADIEGVSFLFTGDIEEAAEGRIVQAYPRLKADILKVAHHGSKTSSTARFLETVQPKVAIISAGRNNLFGHPHEEVVERLENMGIIMKQTKANGAIILKVKNKRMKLEEMIQ